MTLDGDAKEVTVAIGNKVFVYGTLRKGFGNHELLGSSTLLGKAITESKYTMLHLGGFPGVVKGGDTSITGEIYECDDQCVKRLDFLESHPEFYTRQMILVLPVNSGDDQEASWEEVQTYLLPEKWLDSKQKVIVSGDWARKSDWRQA